MIRQTLQLLGPFQVVWAAGTPPRYRSPRAQALLGYLVIERRPVSRNILAALFWPDKSIAKGRSALRRELYNLAALLPDCWEVNNQTARFTPDDQTQIDLDQVQKLEKDGQWQAAADLIGGEFLEGLYLEDNLEFETWIMSERERWRQLAERVLINAAEQEKRQGNYAQASRYLSRLVKIVPWHEEGHRQMMRLLAQQGQFSAALKQYEKCQAILAEELAVSPSIATRDLYERIKEAMALPPHNLPPQATPFIGREDEVAVLKHRLSNPDSRLLTLTGVGGIGKTRLALAVARAVAGDDFRLFLHGVVFVPLVGVDAPDLITAVGSALGLAFSGQQPAERQLFDYLREMEMLLLLDNYEHLLPDTTLLAAILEMTSGVKLLVTSRERLHLQEEWLYEVEGLPYPKEKITELQTADTENLASVHMFHSSARRVQRTFSLETAGREVAAICHLVQGLPLALELSAARLNSLSAADVLAELEGGLGILTTETGNIPSRHASIRAAFDVSWAGLSGREQQAFSRLSLFRGDFTRDAAEEVAGATLSILSSLGDKSLIRLTSSGRYEMHELLRQYASEKLDAYPALKLAAKERYAAYFGDFLYQREARLLETDQEKTMKELAQEMDNIRPAWRWLAQNEKIEMLDGALWTLAFFYFLRGYAAEGLGLMDRTLKRTAQMEDFGLVGRRLQARLRLFQGCFLHYAGRLIEARALLESTLDQFRHVGATQDVGWSLFALGQTLAVLHQYETSSYLPYLKEAYALVRTSGPHWLEGLLAARLAAKLVTSEGERAIDRTNQLVDRAMTIGLKLANPWVLSNAFFTDGLNEELKGEYRRADKAYKQASEAAQRIDSSWMMGLILFGLGHVAYLQEQFARAKQYYLESRLFFRRMGARRLEADVSNRLGEIARAEGELDRAVGYYRKSILMNEEMGFLQLGYWSTCNLGHVLLNQSHLESAGECFHYYLPGLEEADKDQVLAGMIFIGIAGLLAARGQTKLAACLAGAAAARLEVAPRQLEPAEQQDWDRIVAEIREQLDEKAFTSAWNEGREMPLEQAIAIAQEFLERPINT